MDGSSEEFSYESAYVALSLGRYKVKSRTAKKENKKWIPAIKKVEGKHSTKDLKNDKVFFNFFF